MSATDDVYRMWNELASEHGLDYEPDEWDPEVDLAIFEDRLWDLNPGDEFWKRLIEAYRELDMPGEIPMTESRLAAARCFEAGYGWLVVFLSRAGTISCKAAGAFSQPVLLGSKEAMALAEHLRELTELARDVSDTGVLEVSPGTQIAVHTEDIPTVLSKATALERADALAAAAAHAQRESPIPAIARPPDTDAGPN